MLKLWPTENKSQG